MKKLIVICYLLLALGHIPMMADKIDFSLKCEREDEHAIDGGKKKFPIRMPVIYQDDHTLSFHFHHPEYIINIIQDGEVIFSSVISTDVAQYELPDYISGECIIQLIKNDYCFWAEIEL